MHITEKAPKKTEGKLKEKFNFNNGFFRRFLTEYKFPVEDLDRDDINFISQVDPMTFDMDISNNLWDHENELKKIEDIYNLPDDLDEELKRLATTYRDPFKKFCKNLKI